MSRLGGIPNIRPYSNELSRALIPAGRMGDDFCIDEDAGVIYLTTHRQSTIDRVSMNPAENADSRRA